LSEATTDRPRRKMKQAVVTGASRGIGLQCAQKLASLGYSVACVGRDLPTLAQVVQSLPSTATNPGATDPSGSAALAHGRLSHSAHACDVAQPKEVSETIQRIAQQGTHGIHVLVNAAGVVHNGLLARTTDATVATTLGTNLLGPIHLCREVSKVMLKHRTKPLKRKEIAAADDTVCPSGQTIINIGSVVGSSGNVGQCIYSASKSGLVGLTLSLAKELGSRNICVNLIEPGFIDTDMTKDMSTEQRQKIEQSIMLNRFGEGRDVADLVGFLVGDGGRYITGQTLRVDGGLRL